MASVRAFVGCTLDADAMARVVDAQRRARSIAEHAGWRATWVAPENLHATVKFVGEIDETRVAPLDEALARTAQGHGVVRLELDGVGAFPHGRPPRVLFVATRTIEGDLAAIAKDVDAAFESLGVPPETRAFHGHVTLARIKFVPREQGLELFAPKLSSMLTGPARIESLTLFASELRPDGPRYRPLGVHVLGT